MKVRTVEERLCEAERAIALSILALRGSTSEEICLSEDDLTSALYHVSDVLDETLDSIKAVIGALSVEAMNTDAPSRAGA